MTVALVVLSIAELAALLALFAVLRSLYARLDAADSDDVTLSGPDDKWSVTLSSEQINDPAFGVREHTTLITAPNGRQVIAKRLPDSPLRVVASHMRMTREQLDELIDERMTQRIRDAARSGARSAARPLPPQTGQLR